MISELEAGHKCRNKTKTKAQLTSIRAFNKMVRFARDEKMPVSGEMLLFKAQEFTRACGYDNSEKLDINWVNRWKTREEVVCKKLHGEAESVDQDGVSEWQNC